MTIQPMLSAGSRSPTPEPESRNRSWSGCLSRSSPTRNEAQGLGLAISRRIVEQHGGKLTAANREGCGAVFTVELPLSAERRSGNKSVAGSGPQDRETIQTEQPALQS